MSDCETASGTLVSLGRHARPLFEDLVAETPDVEGHPQLDEVTDGEHVLGGVGEGGGVEVGLWEEVREDLDDKASLLALLLMSLSFSQRELSIPKSFSETTLSITIPKGLTSVSHS